MKKLITITMLAIALLTIAHASPQQESSKQQMIVIPICNTLEDLEAFVHNDFVMPDDSSCEEPVTIDIPVKIKDTSFARQKALGLKSFFNSKPWQFGGIVAQKTRLTKENTAAFKNKQFEGTELLYKYGATEEYIANIEAEFEEAKELFGVNATMEFIPESDVGIASTDTETGIITVAFYESVTGTELHLEQFQNTILYHEFGHNYIHKNFGDYKDTPLNFSDLFLIKPFEEYTATLYAYKALPEEKRELFAEGIRQQMQEITYEGIKTMFEMADYPTILQIKLQARKFNMPKIEGYINKELDYQPKEIKEKFTEISEEFYTKAEHLTKETYKETIVNLAEKIQKLNESKYSYVHTSSNK